MCFVFHFINGIFFHYFLQYMTTEILFLVEEAVEGGWTARALGESIYTDAETMEELRHNIKDAVSCHFDEGSAPRVIRLHVVKEEIFAL
jgi:hypothetical protein